VQDRAFAFVLLPFTERRTMDSGKRSLVAVRDLETGEQTSRPADTLTVDVPADLPPGGIFTVADGFRASYLARSGKQVGRKVTPGPLGWRNEGDTCLVARTGGSHRSLRQYRVCRIAPSEAATLPVDLDQQSGPT
jgi:hypothetical protein